MGRVNKRAVADAKKNGKDHAAALQAGREAAELARDRNFGHEVAKTMMPLCELGGSIRRACQGSQFRRRCPLIPILIRGKIK